jgi:ubiquinone/menaquinone biosynthesis C-methylase UbiE
VPVPQRVYELLAQQIIDDYKITEGRCLDVGTGEGQMGIEIAKRSQLRMYLLDVKDEALLKAEANCVECGLSPRTTIIKSPIERLPFINDYFDLVVSRGSIFFWEDRPQGIQEIFRVLKRGGGGFHWRRHQPLHVPRRNRKFLPRGRASPQKGMCRLGQGAFSGVSASGYARGWCSRLSASY